MLRKVLFRATGVKTIARRGVIRLNSEYSKDSWKFITKEWVGKGRVKLVDKKNKLLRRDIKGRGVLAEDRPGESDTKGGGMLSNLTRASCSA